MIPNTIPLRHFYMIRHGETEANVADICAGFIDSPLTAKGRGEAAAVAAIVDGLKIKPAAIFHSHLSRARDTALLLNQNLKLPMHEDARIAERNFGEWHGIPMVELDRMRTQKLQPSGGETDDEFRSRVQNGISDILTQQTGPVLITTHGGAFRAFGELYGITLRGVKNCQLYEFVPHTDGASFPWKIVKHGRVG